MNEPTSASTPGAADDPMLEALMRPLTELQGRYLAAQTLLRQLLAGVESLSAVASAAATPAVRRPAGTREGTSPREPLRTAPRTATDVELIQDDPDSLLDLQQRLAELEGVAGISIARSEDGHLKLVVELSQPGVGSWPAR